MLKSNLSDTICAVPTAPGGSVSVVRLSGGRAVEITEGIFRSREFKKPEDRRLYYGHIVDGGRIVDEVIVTLMLAPKSYTREDVVEISCHGGLSAERILELFINRGARLAEPGEFTKRAFLNGRIALSQAEAVSDLIAAKTELAREMAVNQLCGFLFDEVRELREDLARIFANIEADIDYPEHDEAGMTEKQALEAVNAAILKITSLTESADTGEIIKEGVETVILGRPNVGKSSLMNALLRSDRAIVTETAGTTRDVIREYISLENGVMLRLSDTAGLRGTRDKAEKIGVEKAVEAAGAAALILVVLDSSEPLTEDDKTALKLAEGKRHIVVVNKSDKPKRLEYEGETVEISAATGSGLGSLADRIKTKVFGLDAARISKPRFVSSRRHKAALISAGNSLSLAKATLESGYGCDLAVIDIEDAYRFLGEITGESVDEDLCDKIFSQFCLGK